MDIRAEGMKRDLFMTFHPTVNFLYFSMMIIFAVAIFHPVTCAVSLTGALAYAMLLRGKAAVRFFVKLPFIMMLLIFIMNPVFVHKGVTVWLLIGDIQITKEAFVYGGCSALAAGAVIMWFYCYSQVMTSDRFMAVFGRAAPASSLVFSMVLRFLPRLTNQAGRISEAQDCILCANNGWEVGEEPRGHNSENREGVKGSNLNAADAAYPNTHCETMDGRDPSKNAKKKDNKTRKKQDGKSERIKKGIRTSSVLATWALENSVETADSMRARGYGIKGRTNYTGYLMASGDAVMIGAIAAADLLIITAKATGSLYFAAYPVVYFESTSTLALAAVIVYTVLSLIPVSMYAVEAVIWKRSVSRI